jgi:gp2.52
LSERIYGIKENKSLMDITPSLEASAIIRDSGESITFTGLKSNIPVQLEGATVQEKYSGAQFFNPDNFIKKSSTCDYSVKDNVFYSEANAAATYQSVNFGICSADYANGKIFTISGTSEMKKAGIVQFFWANASGTALLYETICSVGWSGKFAVTKTLVAPENATLLCVSFVIQNSTTPTEIGDYIKVTDFMMVEGTEPKQWEPYTGMKLSPNIYYPQPIYAVGDSGKVDVVCTQGERKNTLSIPLSRPLYSINGITEEITKSESGKWGIQRYFDRIIFDGSEDERWSISDTNTNNKRMATSILKDVIKQPAYNSIQGNLLCNRFIVNTANNVYLNQEGISIQAISSSGTIHCYSNKYNTDDITLWTDFLANNPMEVIYELKTPVWEQLPDDVQKAFNMFSSFNGENVVSVTDETTVKYHGALNTAGAVSDCFTVQDGQFGILRKVGKEVFDGSSDEGWRTLSSSETDKYRLSANSVIVFKPLENNDTISNIANDKEYITITANETKALVKGISTSSDSKLVLYDPAYNTSDVTLWTAYLADSPMTVYYELATPVFEPITSGFIKPKLTIDYAQTAYGVSVLNMLAGSGSGGGSILPDENSNFIIGSYSQATGDAAYNTVVGANTILAPDVSFSTYLGNGAGRNQIGSYNSAFGSNALRGNNDDRTLNTGKFNTAIGRNALHDSTSGSSNTAVGDYALNKITSGGSNTGVGVNALLNATTSQQNVVVGINAAPLLETGGWNTIIGAYALNKATVCQCNTAVGNNSLQNNLTGNNNTSVGYGTLRNNTATGNSAFGYNAATNNTIGMRNTAIGNESLSASVNGYDNTAVGNGALKACTKSCNVAIGSQTLIHLTNGGYNTAAGRNALYNLITGDNNVAIGDGALYSATDVRDCVAIGFNSLNNRDNSAGAIAIGSFALDGAKGMYSVGIGHFALQNCEFGNCVGLGARTTVTGEKQIQLGESGTTPYAYAALQLRSDERDKTDIRDSSLGLDFINALRAREFRWDLREDYREWDQENQCYVEHEKDGSRSRTRYHQGLIAQEVKAAMDSMGVDFAGYQDHKVNGGKDVLSIGYEELIGPLIKAVQELSAEVQQLKAQNSNANSLLSKWTNKFNGKE